MLLLGNDIVALGEPGATHKSHDKRFLERVFTALERKWITSSPQPDRTLWTLWAAKEALYKALARHDYGLVFAHSNFVVEPAVQDADGALLSALVKYRTHHAPCTFVHSNSWVHAHLSAGLTHTAMTVGTHSENSSLAVRTLAAELVHRVGGPPVSVTGRPPVLVDSQGLPANCMVSLSHDGPYAAVSIGW